MKLQSIRSREAFDYVHIRELERKFVLMFFSLTVFLLLFGPKYGLVDISVVGGVVGLLILLPIKSIKLPKYTFLFVVLTSIIVFYSMIVYILAGSYDNYVILRNLRAFFSTLLIPIIIYNVPLDKSVILDTVINVLLLHALVVLIQILIPATKLYFGPLYHFDKSLSNPVRAFGLTAGYDIAGYLCIAGMILVLLSALYKTKNLRYILSATIFGTAVIFTSRVSMVVLLATVLFFSALFIIKGSRKLKSIGIISIIAITIVSGYYIIPIITNTITIGTSTAYAHRYLSFFAKTDIKATFNRMWILPNNEWNILFGCGMDPHSDIGYIKLLFMLGIVGLSLVVGIYLLMLFRILRMLRIRRVQFISQTSEDFITGEIALLTLIILIPLQFILDFKNLYFLTRSVYELTLILFFIAVLSTRCYNNTKKGVA